MRIGLTILILAWLCASCRTVPPVPAIGFSFDDHELPSLMDINQGKFSAPAQGLSFLTNVDKSFAEVFDILYDQPHQACIIRDKKGHVLFSGNLDTPRYVACVDIDADHDLDVILQCAAYGNHGNGSEIFEVLLNDNGHLTRISNPIAIGFSGGQENRAGHLTWVSDSKMCAIFAGEVADVARDGSESNPLRVGKVRAVTEAWGHRDGRMVLLSETTSPIGLDKVKHLSFR